MASKKTKRKSSTRATKKPITKLERTRKTAPAPQSNAKKRKPKGPLTAEQRAELRSKGRKNEAEAGGGVQPARTPAGYVERVGRVLKDGRRTEVRQLVRHTVYLPIPMSMRLRTTAITEHTTVSELISGECHRRFGA